MDRDSGSARPQAPVIGFQRWDKLLFLHWTVSAELLRPLIPARLELDLYEGRSYVSVTPFTPMMLPGRPRSIAAGSSSAIM